ncbi:MAG: iron-containing redox enzyme family protein [Byssovorax sp.]
MNLKRFPRATSVPSTTTYLSVGEKRLADLYRGVMGRPCPDDILALFAEVLDPWGRQPIPDRPPWASEIGDDHSPFEFSVAVGGREPELRILFEAQADRPSPAALWEAGEALNQRLARDRGIDLKRLAQVADLFIPTDPGAAFAMWHSVCLFEHSKPAWKVYLNPQAQGRGRAAAVVEEALCRLGYDRAWPVLSSVAGGRGPDLDELKYFSLDLTEGQAARVKVYYRHHRITAAELERAFAAAPAHIPGDVIGMCEAILDSEGPFVEKPIGSCFSFVEGDVERPSKATLHLPVARYVASDADVSDRVHEYLRDHNMPEAGYEEPIRAFANRPLSHGVGMHSYVSFRREKQGRRLTAYLSPEVFHVEPPAQSMCARKLSRSVPPPEEIVARYEARSMADHPFFRRLAREPVDLGRVVPFLANAHIGIIRDFSRRLASVIGRLPDDRLRSILVKQLNDELGDGDYDKAHAVLFQKMFAGLMSFSRGEITHAMLAPGRAWSERFEAIYSDPDPYVGVGAAMVIEIYGKQVDLCVGKELRRQKELDPGSLTWLVLHEELEVEHAGESLDIARLLPVSGPEVEAAWRGAEAVCAASWAFLDGMYKVIFG